MKLRDLRAFGWLATALILMVWIGWLGSTNMSATTASLIKPTIQKVVAAIPVDTQTETIPRAVQRMAERIMRQEPPVSISEALQMAYQYRKIAQEQAALASSKEQPQTFPIIPGGKAAAGNDNSLLASILGGGKEKQILMFQNGMPVWRNFPTLDQIPSPAPHGTEGTTRADGHRTGGGGGGRDTSAQPSVTNTTNVTNVYNTGSGGGVGVFVGTTTATNYNGLLSASGKTGYEAANTICDTDFADSHLCTADEILNTIASADIYTLFTSAPDAWISTGPPGYTANANDCNGWTSASSSYLAPWWEFDETGGGIGYLTNCSTTKPLACCR